MYQFNFEQIGIYFNILILIFTLNSNVNLMLRKSVGDLPLGTLKEMMINNYEFAVCGDY